MFFQSVPLPNPDAHILRRDTAQEDREDVQIYTDINQGMNEVPLPAAITLQLKLNMMVTK